MASGSPACPLPVSPAAERLRYILGEEDELPTPTLFTEMDTLQQDGDELEWKETARSHHTHTHTHTHTHLSILWGAVCYCSRRCSPQLLLRSVKTVVQWIGAIELQPFYTVYQNQHLINTKIMNCADTLLKYQLVTQEYIRSTACMQDIHH